jgi:hypothetical protein
MARPDSAPAPMAGDTEAPESRGRQACPFPTASWDMDEEAAAIWQLLNFFLFAEFCAIFPAKRRGARRSNRRIGMGKSGCRRNRIARLRRIAREGAKLVLSIASLAAGVAVLGCVIAGVSLAIAGPAAGGLKEGRSAGGWVPAAAVGGGELRAPPDKWEPRGEARICRNWCEKDVDACLYVCKAADR